MKSDLKASSQEVLAGLVERVTFHNEPPAPEAPPALRPRTQNPHRSRRAQPNSALSYPRFPPYEAFERRPRVEPSASAKGRRPKPFSQAVFGDSCAKFLQAV